MKIVEQDARYLRVEATTRIMRYVDDVEFLYQPEHGRVALRSASRLGHSDFGTNRSRLEKVRAWLEQ